MIFAFKLWRSVLARVKLAGCKSALIPPPHPSPRVAYSTDRSKAVVPVLVLVFVALRFILQGNLFSYVLPCVFLFLCFSVHLTLRLPRLGNKELVLVLFVHLFDLRLFGFVCFLFLPLGVLDGLRCVIVALHGLFSYPFFGIAHWQISSILTKRSLWYLDGMS